MSKVVHLPESQMYESRFATVQTTRRQSYNKSLDDIHIHLKKLREKEALALETQGSQTRRYPKKEKGKISKALLCIWKNTFAQLGEEWVFLAVLGMLVAIISYIMDKGAVMCGKAQKWLYKDLADHPFAKYVAWISLPICLILFNVGFTHLVAPKAAGSGIPQIKTTLRGVVMKEFLTWKVLIAKWVGITSTLGSGMPLGKEGPLIHISSIIMTKMGKAISTINGVYMNQSRTIELLGAAWAVGVACTFNAPIGGVLFSIEISTAYFAVRNYWRGFFAAVWGATTYRLLSVWIDGLHTITVVFKTSYFVEFPYDPQELFAFAITGLICGLGGSFYIWCKQRFSRWLKGNEKIKQINKFNRFIYPLFVAVLYSTVTFPLGIGQFIGSNMNGRDQVVSLFSNFTWTNNNLTMSQTPVVDNWKTKHTGIYANLVCFIAYQFVFSIICSSLPIPNGSFIPNFRTGAAIGRIIGELMATWFPLGVRYKGQITKIMPGAYATVGAAAFSGAVTHTMSVCVILFEMTSQITHVIPVLIAVLIANGIAKLLTPSIYDLVIKAAKLPYLPDLLSNTSAIYDVYVEDFMVQDVKFAFVGMTYRELKELLEQNPKTSVFPLVDNDQNMILLGSVPYKSLRNILNRKIGMERRYEAVTRRMHDIQEEPLESTSQGPHLDTEREKIFKKYSMGKAKPTIRRSSSADRNLDKIRVCDLSPEEQKQWEDTELEEEVDFTQCQIDPAPFQLVERTSLLKVHSLFSLLAINFAYVTHIGKLIGIVGLDELREAIESANTRVRRKSVVEAGTLLSKS